MLPWSSSRGWIRPAPPTGARTPRWPASRCSGARCRTPNGAALLTEIGNVLRQRYALKDVLMFTMPYFGTPIEPTQTQRIYEECDFAIAAIGD